MYEIDKKLDERINELLEEMKGLDPTSIEYGKIADNLDILYKLRLKRREDNTESADKLIKHVVRLMEIGISAAAIKVLLQISIDGFKFEETGILGSKIFTETRGMIRSCLTKLIFK